MTKPISFFNCFIYVLNLLVIMAAAAQVETTGPLSRDTSEPTPGQRPAAAHTEATWYRDIQQGLEAALEQRRDALLFFTCSDGSPLCRRLESEILSGAPFLKALSREVVPIKLDFPHSGHQATAEAKLNHFWRNRLGVDTLPALYLADPTGRPYARLHPGVETSAELLKSVREAREQRPLRDAALRRAAQCSGAERLPHLAAAVEAIDPNLLLTCYPELVAEIVRLDPEDEHGYKTRFQQPLYLSRLDAALSEHEYARAANLAKEALPHFPESGQSTQDLLLRQSEALYRLGRLDDAEQALDAAAEAAPNGLRIRHIRSTKLLHYGEFAAALKQIRHHLGTAASPASPEKVLQLVEAAFERFEPEGPAAQELLILKSQALYRQGRLEACRQALRDALDAAPDGSAVEYIRRMQQLHVERSD